ncbi:MAG: DinB family protein [Burkholderiaceae bacterium]|nr:DinB family protein [Burkholderiaceae bacterium]
MSALLEHFRNLARANRLANRRLHAACLQLTDAEFKAPRTSFFPSLWATLNHILIVDWYYIAALYREPDMRRAFVSETPFDRMADLAEAQRVSDERLIAWCDGADEARLEAEVEMDRGDHVQRDLARHVLMHLLTHQIHHRGQAHAMLAGTPIKPPQLDEFVMPSDAKFRVGDLAALGWSEADLFRG